MTQRIAKMLRTLTAMLVFASAVATLPAQSADRLTPYATCRFPDGLEVVDVDSLAQGVTSRDLDTTAGTRKIDLEAGLRIMFAYPNTDFFANAKAEALPAAKYPQLKGYLLDNLKYLSAGNIVNNSVQSPMNGFEVRGIDRQKLEGGVLGIYLLFDNPAHVVTTIYFLNQEPESRKFQSMDEYHALRDRFLASYTGCVRENQK